MVKYKRKGADTLMESNLFDTQNDYFQFFIKECRKVSKSVERFCNKQESTSEDNNRNKPISCAAIDGLIGTLDGEIKNEAKKIKSGVQLLNHESKNKKFDGIAFLDQQEDYELYLAFGFKNFLNTFEDGSLGLNDSRKIIERTKFIQLSLNLSELFLSKIKQDSKKQFVEAYNEEREIENSDIETSHYKTKFYENFYEKNDEKLKRYLNITPRELKIIDGELAMKGSKGKFRVIGKINKSETYLNNPYRELAFTLSSGTAHYSENSPEVLELYKILERTALNSNKKSFLRSLPDEPELKGISSFILNNSTPSNEELNDEKFIAQLDMLKSIFIKELEITPSEEKLIDTLCWKERLYDFCWVMIVCIRNLINLR